MRGLTIVVASADADRWKAALGMASAQAALGARTCLFLDAAAVPLLGRNSDAVFETALELGVRLIACQTGMAQAGLAMTQLDQRIEAGGMTSLLAGLGDDRLVVC